MYKKVIKRLIDVVIAFIALLFVWPFLLLIMVLLYFSNKGAGVFFMQERPGKNEKIFKVIKFKSMSDKRNDKGELLPDKDRITAIGKFIRKTSIDELPQLINVLKGDMSLIGPRPLLPEYLPYYTEKERLRHTVRPGITGWAQVNGRNNCGWNKKLEYDVFYVENLSMSMDFRVILKTIKNVISAKDVNVVPSLKATKLNIERKDWII